ncbi:MAG: hypothetical protein U0793_21615 [Gemmataceae bacterium]
MADETPAFRVDRLPKVDDQIKNNAAVAKARGFFDEFFRSLTVMMEALGNRPLEWGDPRYRTRHRGGVVCQAIESPLNVHFVVFEDEKIVCILDVELLPRYQPDGG